MYISKTAVCHSENPCNGFYGKCLDVKITNLCNGSCSFCIERDGYRPLSVPVKRMIEATNALEDYQTVLILGGEPFLYPHLEEYLNGIRGKQSIYITTNGSAFNEHPLEAIAQYLTAVNISIHYFDQAVNSEIFGTSIDFLDIYEAIKVFKDYGVKVRINTNLIRSAIKDGKSFIQMVSLARKLGADEIRFAELQHSPKQYVSAQEVFEGILRQKLPDDPFTGGCEHILPFDSIKVTIRMACGFVNPCRSAPEFSAGRRSQTKVLYPDASVSDGWRIPELSVADNNRSSYSDWSCHGRSCH